MAKDPTADHEDQSPETEAMRARRYGKVECYESNLKKGPKAGQRRFFWRARATNGEVVADSGEGYNSEAARDNGLDAARMILLHGQRVDL